MNAFVASKRCDKGVTWYKVVIIALLLGILVCTCGCGTMANGHRRSDHAFSNINAGNLTRAARIALLGVNTLFPATAAILFAAADFDEPVSDWI